MTRVLVVRAHPLAAPVSRSMTLADRFVETYTAAHPKDDLTELRLYDVAIPEIDLDLLTAWSRLRAGTPFAHLESGEQVKSTLFDHYTAQFLAADTVVVVNPLWNLMVPTRLKAWFDTVSVGGKTFRYNELGEPVGLVPDKSVVHIQASGGVFGGNDPASVFVRTMFTFLGVTRFQQVRAEGMDHEPQRADEIMAAALERVAEAARSL